MPSVQSSVVLALADVRREFAGVSALDGVTFSVLSGAIHGLIGPNGAGKTSLANVVSGQDRPTSGTVTIAGEQIRKFRPDLMAHRGIGRTFQTSLLVPDMTVLENVKVGGHMMAGNGLLRQLIWTSRAAYVEARIEAAAVEWLNRLGLSEIAHQRAHSLPYGLRRMTEIARAMMPAPAILLLDEPAAGMSKEEATDLSGVLRQIRDEHSTTVILIEHNVEMVMSLCDTVTVLAQGKVIAHGQPADVRKDPNVITAYLGH